MAMGTQPPTLLWGTGLILFWGTGLVLFWGTGLVLFWGTRLFANTVSVGHYDFRKFSLVNTRHPGDGQACFLLE